MKLALITGTGTSTALGRDSKLPMMPELNRALYDALENAARGLAEAIHMEPEMSGPDCETAFGTELLRWRGQPWAE